VSSVTSAIAPRATASFAVLPFALLGLALLRPAPAPAQPARAAAPPPARLGVQHASERRFIRSGDVAATSGRVCAARDAAARVVDPLVPETPPIAQAMGAYGIARISVELATDGTVVQTSIARSSGNRWLDDAAVRTVRAMRYTAEVRDCNQIGGTYLVTVEFADPNS
jgi:periplasmic protein TonB